MDLTSFLALATLISAAFGYVGQVLSESGIRVYFFDLFLLSCLIYAIRSGKLFSGWRDERIQPWFLFCLALTASYVFNLAGKSGIDMVVGGSYLVRVFGLVVVYMVFLDVEKLRLERYFLLALGVFVMFGLGQYLFIPDTRDIALLGFDDHYYRLIGTLLDPNFAGLVLVFGVLYFVNRGKGLLALVLLFCLALTFSRSSFLALGVSYGFYVLKSRDWKLLSFILAFILFVWVAPKPFGEGVNLTRTYSIVSRVENSKEVVSGGMTNWLYGEGYNFVAAKKGETSEKGFENRGGGIDNSILLVLTSSGVIGILSLIYLLWRVSVQYKDNLLVLSSGVALVVHSLTNNSLFFVPVMVFFLGLVAMERKMDIKKPGS